MVSVTPTWPNPRTNPWFPCDLTCGWPLHGLMPSFLNYFTHLPQDIPSWFPLLLILLFWPRHNSPISKYQCAHGLVPGFPCPVSTYSLSHLSPDITDTMWELTSLRLTCPSWPLLFGFRTPASYGWQPGWSLYLESKKPLKLYSHIQISGLLSQTCSSYSCSLKGHSILLGPLMKNYEVNLDYSIFLNLTPNQQILLAALYKYSLKSLQWPPPWSKHSSSLKELLDQPPKRCPCSAF